MRTATPAATGFAGAGAALWGTAAAAFNAAGAFVVFLGFGQQAAAAILAAPLAVAAMRAAGGDRRALLAGGLLLAALMVTYSPALTLAGAILAGVALGESAAAHRSHRPAIAIGAVGLLAASLVPFAVVRLGVRAGYLAADGGVGGLTRGPGVEHFPPLAWGLGLLPGPGVAQDWGVPLALPWMLPAVSIGLVGLAACLALAGAVQLWRQRAWAVLGALAGAAALLIALRIVTPYPYGFFKLLPTAAPLLLLLPTVGVAALGRVNGGNAQSRLVRYGSLTIAGVMGAVMLANGAVAAYTARLNSPHESGEAGALAALVEPGDRVCIEGGRGLEGPSAGAAANALWSADLYGDFQTGYSSSLQLCQWHLLPTQAPTPPIIADPPPVWEGLGWRLLRRNPEVTAALDLARLESPPHIDRTTGPGRAALLPINAWRPDGGPYLATWSPPLMGVLTPMWGAQWRWPELTAAGIWLSFDERGLSVAPQATAPVVSAATGEAGSLVIVIAADDPSGQFEVSGSAGTQEIALPEGAAIVNAGSLGHGESVRLRTPTGQIRLRAAYLLDRPDHGISAVAYPQSLPLTTDGAAADGQAMLLLHGPTGGAEAVLDAYREDGAVHYGYWQLGTAALPGAVTLDLAGRTLTTADGQEPPHQVFAVADGRYRGLLHLYRNGAPERSNTLFSFHLRGGVASDFVMESRGDRLW